MNYKAVRNMQIPLVLMNLLLSKIKLLLLPKQVHKAVRNMQMPLVLMNLRFDGKFGFFGGIVEQVLLVCFFKPPF
jgi:hypothetical protein